MKVFLLCAHYIFICLRSHVHFFNFLFRQFGKFHYLRGQISRKPMSKKKSLPLFENVTIEAVAAEGKCVTHVDDMAVFVPFCVPGDVVDLQVTKRKHKYCEARVTRFVKMSEVRAVPFASISAFAVVASGRTCPTRSSSRPSSNRFTTSCIASGK